MSPGVSMAYEALSCLNNRQFRCKRRLRPIGYTGFAAAVEERVSF